MKYLFVIVFVMMFALFGKELGYTDRSPLYTHMTYMFQHAGVVHLITNTIAFIGMFHALQRFVNKWIVMLSMLTLGFVASFLSMYEIPTVGASSMIYIMIGMYIGMTSLDRRIKIVDTRKYLLFIVCVAVGLLVSLLKQNSNFFLHLYSLLFGFIASVPLALKKA
jgi:membrane associated rhomboid family serine protease